MRMLFYVFSVFSTYLDDELDEIDYMNIAFSVIFFALMLFVFCVYVSALDTLAY